LHSAVILDLDTIGVDIVRHPALETVDHSRVFFDKPWVRETTEM
jgi:hypothetical protein